MPELSTGGEALPSGDDRHTGRWARGARSVLDPPTASADQAPGRRSDAGTGQGL